MEAATSPMWVDLGLIAVAVIAVFFSPYRRWLGFMLAGMLSWGLIKRCALVCKPGLKCRSPTSYLTAAVLTVTFILYVKTNKHKTVAKRQYIEHTQFYKDDQQQMF